MDVWIFLFACMMCAFGNFAGEIAQVSEHKFRYFVFIVSLFIAAISMIVAAATLFKPVLMSIGAQS